MGLRFRRTIKLFPGVRLNLSKSGVSTSIGVRGAHVTIGHGKTRSTVGVPGTGLSYTSTATAKPAGQVPAWFAWVAIVGVIVLVGVLAR